MASDEIIDFPDLNLKAAILKQLGKSSSENITKKEASEIMQLNLNESNISDSSGIEHFTSLMYLKYCWQ